jgi:hypothetical protein
MNKFILLDDFKAIATGEDLIVLSDDNIKIIEQCNAIAINEASAYFSSYDIEKLFADPKFYNSSIAFKKGDVIYDFIGTPGEQVIYTCILDAPIGTALTNGTYFIEKDSRDQKLLQVLMSMSLFYIHSRLTPNNIPQFRVLAYDGNGDDKIMSAIKWLTMIQNGKLTPYNWPLAGGVTTEDPDGIEGVDNIGDDPNNGMLWGNDMLYDYLVYNAGTDPNLIKE